MDVSEYRQELVSGTWTILAPQRSRRPHDFHSSPGWATTDSATSCPFCAGHEDATPDPLLVLGGPVEPSAESPHGLAWQVRVVPNLFPALTPSAPLIPFPERELKTGGTDDSSLGAWRVTAANGDGPPRAPTISLPGFGWHEVIVEAPHHAVAETDIDDRVAEWGMEAMATRTRSLAAHPHIRYVQVFRNRGPDAGASLEHRHSQLLALPSVPLTVQNEWERTRAWQDQWGSCLLCELGRQTLAEPVDQVSSSGEPQSPSWEPQAPSRELDAPGNRVIFASDRFLVYCPYASRVPYEIWIQPRHHAAHWHLSPPAELAELSQLLHRTLIALESLNPNIAYNWWIHTSPFDRTSCDHYHWHIEIFPRIAKLAGFELATGWAINPVDPLQAARELRRGWPTT